MPELEVAAVGFARLLRGAGLDVPVGATITFAEAHRAVVRARASGLLKAADARAVIRSLRTLERRIAVVGLSERTLNRVRRPFPVEPVRTLDGIHLAAIELLSEAADSLVVLTRDRRVSANARAAGLVVEDGRRKTEDERRKTDD